MGIRTLDHPVFGHLRRERAGGEDFSWWEGRARIDSLAGCRQRWWFDFDPRMKIVAVVENTETSAATRNEFEIMIKDERDDGPAPEQERAFAYLLAHGDAVLRSALTELAGVAAGGYYDSLLANYGGPDPDAFLDWVAGLSTVDGIREMVVLTKVDFCLTIEDGMSLVALNFYVAHPQDDHGLAVVLHKDQVRGGGMAEQYEPE